MTAQQQNVAPTLADQAREIAEQATEDMAQRGKVRAARDAETPRQSHDRLVFRALFVALPVLGIAVAINIVGLSPTAWLTPAPPPAVARPMAQQELELAVTEIESFRSDYSELPESLVEVGAAPGGEWTYRKTAGGSYEVIRKLHGQVVTFHSARNQVVR